jgi:methionine-R-sulfoxide reductase
MEKLILTETEWKKKLSKKRYEVLRNKGTDMPFTGDLLHNKEEGTYSCAGCGLDLFGSDTKFDSGSGWPSFYDVIEKGNIEIIEDRSHGMVRTEIVCARCGGHLGHVFDDGPGPTGLRYCVNSSSLNFS